MSVNYVLLGEQTVGNGGAASVTFDNIPQTGYTDLKIVSSARTTDTSSYGDAILVRFNGLTTNYTSRRLYGTGAGANSTSGTTMYAGFASSNGQTASTFGNAELYIPNYTSTTVAKSSSSDGVSENNSANAIAQFSANLWNPGTQAAITSITLLPEVGASFVSGSTFSLYGIANANTTPAIAPKADGGNIVANDGTYWYHAFTSSGYFVPQVGLTADVLVVAGGGGGANNIGGGGGAGGYRTSTLSLTATSYTCTVGAGGSGGGGNNVQINGTKGGNSSFSTITSTGGGYGAVGDTNGGAGGSGGGTRGVVGAGGAGNQGAYSPVEGYAGANATQSYLSGSGGGATQAGTQGTDSVGGNGGNGSSSCSSWGLATGTGHNVSGTVYYAGGGGSAGYQTHPAGNGGNGGGGAGVVSSNATGVAGTVNTGGGGGGGAAVSGTNYGGAGGSGIVIIRYAMA